MLEEKDYQVTIVLKLHTRVGFAEMERDGPITELDAIDNAIGSMPVETWNEISSGFGGEYVTEMEFHVRELQ